MKNKILVEWNRNIKFTDDSLIIEFILLFWTSKISLEFTENPSKSRDKLFKNKIMKIKLVIFILMLLSLEPISSNSINNTSKSDDKFCLVLVKVESYINFTLVKKIYVSKIFIVYDKSNDHGGHDLKEGKICDAFKGWLSDNYSELIKNSTNNIWCNKLTFYNDYFDASRDKDALKQQNIDYEIVNTDWSWEK